MLRLLLLCALTLSACDWAAVDGPWNEDQPQAVPPDPVSGSGIVSSPDGSRPIYGVSLRWETALGEEAAAIATDPEGGWSVEGLEAGYYSLGASRGHFSAVQALSWDSPGQHFEEEPLRLSRYQPVVLDVRSPDWALEDLVAGRLEGLGLTAVRDGPTDVATAAELFAQPQGLSENHLILLGGGFDWSSLAQDEAALGGLEDFLAAGGGLYLSVEAWPVFNALAAEEVVSLHPEPSTYQFVEADVLEPVLVEELGWPRIGVPLTAGQPILQVAGGAVRLLLEGEVEDALGAVVEAPLAIELDWGEGRVTLVGFRAPESRPDEWWQGSPAAWTLSDGSWDGRGALIDRLFFRL